MGLRENLEHVPKRPFANATEELWTIGIEVVVCVYCLEAEHVVIIPALDTIATAATSCTTYLEGGDFAITPLCKASISVKPLFLTRALNANDWTTIISKTFDRKAI